MKMQVFNKAQELVKESEDELFIKGFLSCALYEMLYMTFPKRNQREFAIQDKYIHTILLSDYDNSFARFLNDTFLLACVHAEQQGR